MESAAANCSAATSDKDNGAPGATPLVGPEQRLFPWTLLSAVGVRETGSLSHLWTHFDGSYRTVLRTCLEQFERLRERKVRRL
jgi:hypothetical protein